MLESTYAEEAEENENWFNGCGARIGRCHVIAFEFRGSSDPNAQSAKICGPPVCAH